MANILSDAKKQQVIALGQLGWTLRRIEAATGVRRETAGAYLKAAGVSVRPPGRWGHPPANPAKEVSGAGGPKLRRPSREVRAAICTWRRTRRRAGRRAEAGSIICRGAESPPTRQPNAIGVLRCSS